MSDSSNPNKGGKKFQARQEGEPRIRVANKSESPASNRASGDDRGARRFDGPKRNFGEDRGPRRDFGDRPPRKDFGDRPPRKDFGDRPPRREFGDRGPRQFGDKPSFGDRGPRKDFGDRPPRREFGNDRGPRKDFGDRPPRREFGNDRGPRQFGDKPAFGDRGPRKDFGDRPPRREFGNDRGPRQFGDKPAFGDRGPRKDFGDRPPRREFGDRGPRKDFGDRPPRREFGNDRGPRKDFGDKPGFGDRGPRKFGDKPGFGDRGPRKFGDKPSFGDRGPRKDFGDRPKRNFGDADRPKGEHRAKSYNDSNRSDRGGFKKEPYPRKKASYPRVDGERPSNFKGTGRIWRDNEESLAKGSELISGYVRLNRYLASSGLCSRREADSLIEQGLIKVNGEVVTQLGVQVGPRDKVQYDGRKVTPDRPVYILMNKPKGYITTTSDPEERKTVMDLIDIEGRERIFPVGRLDRNTTGVLLLTNDGELAQALTHPSFEIKKIYRAKLDKKPSKEHMLDWVNGIELEDGQMSFEQIGFVEEEDETVLGLEIHSGRNRIVRRMFEHLGYEVESLDRVLMGEFDKVKLGRGMWRFLNEKEIRYVERLKRQTRG